MRISVGGILKSPILHFLIGGVVLFALYSYMLPPEKEEIIITRQTMSSLISSEQEFRKDPLDEDEVISLIQDYIDEEVLIREAYKQGLDRSNYRVRKQLIDLMRSGLNENIPNPGDEALKLYFLENQDDFRVPALRNFKHVFFEFENDDLPRDLTAFLEYFDDINEDFNEAGDLFLKGYEFRHLSFEQCSIFFGREFAESLFLIPEFSWAGPVSSEEGIHFVLMEQVFEERIPDYEDIKIYLAESYNYTKNKEIQNRKINSMRESYRIVIEESEQK